MKARLAAVAVATVVAFAAAPALAREKEHRLGLDAGLTMLTVGGTPYICCGLGGHYVYGLTDAFNFMAEGSASVVSFRGADPSSPSRPTMASHLTTGLAYTLDVATFVPYGGVLVGGYLLNGGGLSSPLPLFGAELAIGLDWRLSHTWTVGFAIRQHELLTKLNTYASYTDAFFTFDYAWGW
jgi:hypothetical protein